MSEERTKLNQVTGSRSVELRQLSCLYAGNTASLLSGAADRIDALEAALADIAVMPEIDQDDAHRLRNKAYVALGAPNPNIHS